ncbi:MAG: MFS transporter [Acidimicrobiales bacterium]
MATADLLARLGAWARYPYVLEEAHAPAPAAGAEQVPAGDAARSQPLHHGPSPFGRLATMHSLSSGGDAVVAVALAGSVFFDVSASAAQSRVALSLALTVAPFALVGPLLGPLVERARAGRRAIATTSAAGRAICCLFMAYWVHSLALFPIAFFSLVFSKLYLVTKAALVPTSVARPGQLVLANSKLAVGGSAAGLLAGSVGAGVMALMGAPALLRLGIVVYAACAWAASRLTTAVKRPGGAPSPGAGGLAPHPTGLPPGGLQLAALATAALRFSAGFVTFLLVFTFRRHAAALIWYGLALGASQAGNVAGAVLAPRLRRLAREEWMLTAASVAAGAAALLAGVLSWGTHWFVAVVFAGVIGLAAGSGKLAFDSMVQRDVPSEGRGRAFARFESGFQLSWAVGGLLAVLVPMALPDGFVAIGAVGLLGAVAFAGGTVEARRGALPGWFPGSAPRPAATRTGGAGEVQPVREVSP